MSRSTSACRPMPGSNLRPPPPIVPAPSFRASLNCSGNGPAALFPNPKGIPYPGRSTACRLRFPPRLTPWMVGRVTPCAPSEAAHQPYDPNSSESQRDSVLQPMVATQELPWDRPRRTPPTPTELRPFARLPDRGSMSRSTSAGLATPQADSPGGFRKSSRACPPHEP